jgi:uncharacterized membrane-anchored protein
VTTRTCIYTAAIFSAAVLLIGLTTLVVGVATHPDAGPVILAGTILTVAAALVGTGYGYLAHRHRAAQLIDRERRRDLNSKILGLAIAQSHQPPESESKVVPFGIDRRPSRESSS